MDKRQLERDAKRKKTVFAVWAIDEWELDSSWAMVGICTTLEEVELEFVEEGMTLYRKSARMCEWRIEVGYWHKRSRRIRSRRWEILGSWGPLGYKPKKKIKAS